MLKQSILPLQTLQTACACVSGWVFIVMCIALLAAASDNHDATLRFGGIIAGVAGLVICCVAAGLVLYTVAACDEEWRESRALWTELARTPRLLLEEERADTPL